jgi:glycosyltransferase involved in cell wall biosynthesis
MRKSTIKKKLLMSKNLKDLTAIICTLNAERHLENCLENLIAINLKKIIAIDANSTDRTIEILKKKYNNY